jgi:hypothetical protein
MIRRAGVMPPDAPQFSPYLDADLLNYAYAALADSLDLLTAIEGNPEVAGLVAEASNGFVQSSYALEAATRNAETSPDAEFHRVIAGAASHLGGYAARAFSLVQGSRLDGRLTPMEATLADLVMRDLDAIEQRTLNLRGPSQISEQEILSALSLDGAETADAQTRPEETLLDQVGPVVLLLTENYLAAVSAALFAIEVGNRALLDGALDELALGQQAALDVSAPGPWWVYRLTHKLLGDLFDTSIQTRVPTDPPAGAEERAGRWRYLRRTFIESLLARGRSEIDLWPSQLHVVDRIFQDARDLVVALPTGAGKTRIAELSILACLAKDRRVVYVTPLRALSAQTERILAHTFSPLGIGVSSLYGSMGVSGVDEDTLRSSEIVVATPEKLDFALRSDPAVLDDVGLVVLDEGHMIGASEREVRYEAQIQRLLKRADADERRILCLSAVFPSGTQLEDFVAWITDDEPDGLHREAWRPTQQRFGLVEWRDDHARLTITLGADQPFIPRFFEATTPSKPRRRLFPADQRELVIATAWRLIDEGQSVLVFCPQRNSVEPYAREIIRLHRQGLVASVLPPDVDLTSALVVGAEWFGPNHPFLQCLQLGVAIHHGALPGPFRREVERLLHLGVLKVTVASPTLAQGLNLTASTVLFHGVRRGRDVLKGSEFANVIGRAGRPFVDTEGLVLYPIFEPTERRRREWLQLTEGEGGKALESGLIDVGRNLLRRMLAAFGFESFDLFVAYLTGGPDWTLPVLAQETSEEFAAATASWQSSLGLLDIGILNIIGEAEQDTDADAAIQALADALHNSLWDRQLRRLNEGPAATIRELVFSRTRHLWRTSTPAQRRGWFLAGLGADAGMKLAQVATEMVAAMSAAEIAIADGDSDLAVDRLVRIAESLFGIPVFSPETALDNWREVLEQWLRGMPLADLAGDRVEVAQFIGSDLVYRLVWGMEAARVFETAQGNLEADNLSGSAVAAIETGTFDWSAAVLIRSGFDHRLAAIAAVESTGATFDSAAEMRRWIADLDPFVALDENWPTPETRSAWVAFAERARRRRTRRWRRAELDIKNVTWFGDTPPRASWLRVTDSDQGRVHIWSTGFDLLGEAHVDLNRNREGVLRARKMKRADKIQLRYRGPSDLVPRRHSRK